MGYKKPFTVTIMLARCKPPSRIVDGFIEPTDAILAGNNVSVIEYGERGGDMWKITLLSKNKKENKH